MRSITTKAICTILITALVLGLSYFAIFAPRNTGPQNPTTNTPTTSTSPTIPTSPTTVPPTTVHTHLFVPGWHFDENHHWTQCDCGEKSSAISHTDSDRSGACDDCGYAMELPHEHSFSQTWQSDETNHWKQCECGQGANIAAHADRDEDGTCDICDYVLFVPHTHDFGETWRSDEENHWQQCECGEIQGTAAHIDEDVNGACDTCGYAMEIPHQHDFGTAWESNENSHWQQCECGEISGSSSHLDANRNGKCDVCAHAVSLPEPPALNSQHAFIFDCDKNAYLYRCEETHNTPIYPASITKLFTCYVALQYLTDLDEEILLGDEQTLYAADASRAFFDRGETISVNVLLHGALMPSGSDATYALAAAAGKKILNNPNASGKEAVDAFMVEMNSWAQKLGMGDTHFVTPDGYHHNQHYVSFHAFVTIARCAMGNPHILSICGKAQETVTYKNVSGVYIKHILNNSNKLLSSSNSCYIAEAVGLKTGTTDEAGCCFLGVFIHNGKAVIIGIFGCSTDANRWNDTQALWEYYLALEAFLS